MRIIELLAPARDAETAIEAIKHGADAVYIGADSHGARAAACNSVADIKRVVDYAHVFNARVYVTVNTIIYDNELSAVSNLIQDLYRVGVDALIVQDMSILRMTGLPPIALHSSTQCDTRDVAKAKFLQDVGFSQIVLARELSLDEIREIHQAVNVPLEAFVHGALCVSYSGDCQASFVATGRSANRGECAQMCRLPYDLYDGNGAKLMSAKHLLSLRDMNRIAYVGEMIEAGVSSFKIEGRLKDAAYVKNTVAAYSKALDEFIAANSDKYRRQSVGRCETSFTPDLSKSFNRGYVNYFLKPDSVKPGMASIDTPKSVGQPVATVVATDRRGAIVVKASAQLCNGDGLGYFDASQRFCGFRLNRVEGNKIYPATAVKIPVGTQIFRNSDKAWNDKMAEDTSRRVIDLTVNLYLHGNRLKAIVYDTRGNNITVMSEALEIQPAKTPQQDARKRVLSKLGDTPYCLATLNDAVGDYFIPASVLTSFRRLLVDRIDSAQRAVYKWDYRRPEDSNAVLPQKDGVITYHDNVSNRLSRRFYESHGATSIQPAIEKMTLKKNSEYTVMTTRYCLRREMGKCLKLNGGGDWKAPLFIKTGNHTMRLDFDCKACRMKVIYFAQNK